MTASHADRPCLTIVSKGATSTGAAAPGTREFIMKPFNAGTLIGTTNDAAVPMGSGS